MKIYQTLKLRSFVFALIGAVVAVTVIIAMTGNYSIMTPRLFLLAAELAAMLYGTIFGSGHLIYCTPEIPGYKFFRSLPDYEKKYRNQCIFADIITFGVGYAITGLNLIFTANKGLSVFAGILYLFIIALLRLIASFKSISAIIYYMMPFLVFPFILVVSVFLNIEKVPNNLIGINVQLIIIALVTVFVAVSETVFYKRLSKNLRTSYGKG